MSFFEPPPPPPEPEPGPPPPEWIGPPDNELPSTFVLDLVLARTEELAIAVHSGRAYERGFEFALGLHMKQREVRDNRMMRWHGGPGAKFDDELMRFGIAYADGRKATVFDPHPWSADPERAAKPNIVLMQRGGGGGGASWEFRYWAWPLPPEGPIDFVVEWPAEGIALTRTAVDSAVVRDAAAQAETLWPDTERHGKSGAWTRYA